MNYSLHIKYNILQTKQFRKWFKILTDKVAIAAITRRIERLSEGNSGDTKTIGNNLFELRFDIGKGYRIYFTYQGLTIIILVLGGNKSSQEADIKEAKKLAKEIKNGNIIEI